MVDEKTPPSSEEFKQLLARDPKREAVDAEYGYHWQRWLTIERWIELSAGEALWIEWAEDLATGEGGQGRVVQAKSSLAPISLGQQLIRDIIGRAFARDAAVKTEVWTRAPIGTEQGDPFGEPGISLWRRIQQGDATPKRLKTFLSEKNDLGAKAQAL